MGTGPGPPAACPDGCGTYPAAFTFDNTANVQMQEPLIVRFYMSRCTLCMC